mgnify:FL=1
MKEFTTPKDFCRFIMNFEGELVVYKNTIYHNGIIIGIFKPIKNE